MTRDDTTRRMFLRGLAGSALAIPYLPSVCSRAFAQAPIPSIRPRFMAICTDHGGVWGQSLYPSSELLTQSAPVGSRCSPRTRVVSRRVCSLR